jgi:uridine kinase
MTTNQSNDPYYKILDTIHTLKNVASEFNCYSANDIKNLINSKMKSKKREPKALQQLYDLEKRIGEIRDSFVLAKIIYDKEEKEHEPSNT